MSGSSVGGIVGGGIGLLFGVPQLGFMLGSALGGIVSPTRIRSPGLKDAPIQTAQEGVKIPFGYGRFTCPGHLLYCSDAEEHIRKEGGKGGGPVVETPYYTRNYAIAICAGPRDGSGVIVTQVRRNGKLVYDITPTSTIRGKNAKFLRKATIYPGTETQGVDPTLEAIFGVGNIQPFKGLSYVMFEDDECPNAAAVDSFDFTVQNCGSVTNLLDTTTQFIVVPAQNDTVYTATRTATYTTRTGGLSGGTIFSHVGAWYDCAVAIEDTGQFWRSLDDGVTWVEATTAPVANRTYRGIAHGNGRWVALAAGNAGDSGNTYVSVSTDAGDNWTETLIASIDAPQAIAFGGAVFVVVTGLAGTGIHKSTNGTSWTAVQAATSLEAVHFNGTEWLAVGLGGKCYSAPANASAWTLTAASTAGVSSFRTLCGQPGYFIAHAAEPDGIWRSTDSGANWTSVGASAAPPVCAASGAGVDILSDTSNTWWTTDAGLTFNAENPPHVPNDIAYIAPDDGWLVVPDADGLYADEDGVLVTDYADTQEASDCSVTVGEIVADLCDRVGLDPDEYDVTELTDEIDGYRCAIEASAYGFIEPLMHATFFDRAEWDKKLRFVKRGGSSVATLTMDDLTARDGPPIVEDLVDDETVLLRKINVLTINPAANYSVAKQTWERTSNTIQAVGESTFDLPIVCPADLGAQVAEKKGKIAWSEFEKRDFGLTVKHSYLTPTDIVTLTDHESKVHLQRLETLREERGAISVEGAVKTRASTYSSTATGVDNPNTPTPTEGLVGPTLLALMNLAQLRNQDATPGIYVGMAGVLEGWPGAQLLMSVDGGVSYQPVLTVTVPTIMGTLTEDEDSNGEPLRVHVFGGDLSSKTTAQVAVGENYSGVITAGVTEVLAYEDATETAPSYYDLETITRGLEGSAIAGHSAGDQFVDLSTAYFVPISQAYAGQTLYFKAVGLGLSPDAIDAVSFVYEGWEYVYDGGGDP